MQKLTAIKAKALIQDLSGLRTIREELFRQALEIALPVLEQEENRHQWDAEGERCVKCGDKDWFAGDKCKGSTPQPSTAPQIDNDGREG